MLVSRGGGGGAGRQGRGGGGGGGRGGDREFRDRAPQPPATFCGLRQVESGPKSEAKLFENIVTSGINFDKYENIPVRSVAAVFSPGRWGGCWNKEIFWL
jgi:hypothetical protein